MPRKAFVGFLQKCLEEWAAHGENQRVCFQLDILAGQGDICEVTVGSQFSEGRYDVRLKIVPLYRKFFVHCLCGEYKSEM